MKLPVPSCPMGYTGQDLCTLLGDREDEFWYFMRGQTMILCDGSTYDHERQSYFTTACSDMLPGMPLLESEVQLLRGHGGIVFRGDLERFLMGLPVID